MPTLSEQQALATLRQGSQTFQWYVVPLLASVFYVCVVEVEKRKLNIDYFHPTSALDLGLP